jgi:alpha-L-fucosidase 2
MIPRERILAIVFLLTTLPVFAHTPYASLQKFSIQCMTRDAAGEPVIVPTALDPNKTAIIIIDMWNFHWCMTATERVSAMVPRMNAVLDIARKLGMQIIWNPSDVVTAYSGYPQYEKALAVEHRHAPEIRPALATKFTAPVGDCMCGPGFRCGVNYGWDGMHPDLLIGDSDLISASTDEIYSLLADRGITNIIYMGVATNMCVYVKPGAISHLWKAGFNCLLARDLNDAFTTYDPVSGYTPDQGTTEIDENLQTAGIPTVNMGEEFRKAELLKFDVPLDYVRFAPWGKPERPYLTDKKILVTLTAPWLEGTEIRYTSDGSEPTKKSPLYTAPLEISQTTVLRAAAFRKGNCVSLPSSAYYAVMTAIPPKPDVYLEDLPYFSNAYLPSFLWQPQKCKSFEGKPLRVSGKSYDHGMGFRAPSSVQYEIKPEYKRFVALAGIDENMLGDINGRFVAMHSSVVFRLFIDGKPMAESPVMRISQEPWRFDVEIPPGSHRINLVCMDAGSRSLLDYGNWIDAGFISKEIAVNQVPMKWWYDVPATKFWEGLPIGTGRFGAMIPGSIDHEVISFNDETLWTGGPYNPNNPEGPEILKKVREYAFAHKWLEATNEAWKLSSDPVSIQNYQAMAQLNIRYDGHDPDKASGYKRSLDMGNALVDIDYQIDGVSYSRKVFASYPDQVIVIRLTADKKGKINLSGWFTSLQPSASTHVEQDEIVMEGSTIAKEEGTARKSIYLSPGFAAYLKKRNVDDPNRLLPPQMKWQSKVKIIPEGGTLTSEGDKLVLKDADAATLILAGATNWKAWNDVSADAKQRCDDYVFNAARQSYKQLLKRHLDDYCPLFAACKIDLGSEPDPSMTTTQSMEAIRGGAIDPAYEARYFQYGRYLLLAASRENTLAFNNHNIWLNDLTGRWNGRWTLNFNLQECFWPIENANLPKVNESLVYFVEQLAQAGAHTAHELYGCRGWCSHLGADVWFNTAPTDGHPQHAVFPVSGMWLMQQLYDHYLYDPDPAYLKRIYPLLKGSVEFCLDFLVKDPETGYMVICPSTSPENSFVDDKGNRVAVSYGSSGDNQIVRNLLRNFIEASKVLKVDTQMSRQSAKILNQLPPHRVGSFGQLQEWLFDFKEFEVTHRHMMHLFAVYPDDDITIRKTPQLAEAAKVVLKRRGDFKYKGMFSAWKINLYARLEETEKAYNLLHTMLTDVSVHPYKEDSRVTPSMEGNQGVTAITAGITEMLMQSHSSELSLLPALPAQWKDGTVQGLRARGGFDVDMTWKDNVLTKAVVKANYDKSCRLRTKSSVKVLSSGKEVKITSLGENLIEFEAKAGKKYEIVTI